MTQITLTAPVDKDTQLLIKKIANQNKIPIRVLCAMLIKQGLDDILKGKLHIVQPSIEQLAANNN